MLINILQNSLMITVFVLAMMLLIEYINLQSKGKWANKLQNSLWKQLLISAFFGVIPGCLGAYTIVTMFTHNLVKFSALITVMIATSGDEAFVMFSMMPKMAIILNISIFVIAVAAGFLTEFVMRKYKLEFTIFKNFIDHKKEYCDCNEGGKIKLRLQKISFVRALLLTSIGLFMFFLITGKLDEGHNHGLIPTQKESVLIEEENNHEHEHTLSEITEVPENEHEHGEEKGIDWIMITFLAVSAMAFFIIATAPEHFLMDHLWEHIIKKHLPKIFLWTVGTLLFIHFLVEYIDLGDWLKQNHLTILILAVLVGIIPESGPHLIFFTLFMSGNIPFSILLASSIVQDGHAALPLFAESKKSFVLMKLINIVVGLIVGLLGLYVFNF